MSQAADLKISFQIRRFYIIKNDNGALKKRHFIEQIRGLLTIAKYANLNWIFCRDCFRSYALSGV